MSAPATRLTRRFDALRADRRAGLVTFITAGDPDLDTSLEILRALPRAGADVIELGIPFSDPVADGPAIQAGSQRALRAGGSLRRTLEMVERFRELDDATPIVLMGYFNPVHAYGVARFVDDARRRGVDGLIMVDLPPEEDEALCLPAREAGIHFIRLVAPTTDDARLGTVLTNSSGFIYYVSVRGVTGTAAPDIDAVGAGVARLRARSDLPVAVGFGVRTPEQAAAIGSVADAVVVGSALVEAAGGATDAAGAVYGVTSLVDRLAMGLRRKAAARP